MCSGELQEKQGKNLVIIILISECKYFPNGKYMYLLSSLLILIINSRKTKKKLDTVQYLCKMLPVSEM